MTAGVLLAWLAAAAPGAAFARADLRAYTSESEVDSAMRRLHEERDEAQEAVEEAYGARRKAMTQSDDWPLETRRERRERLNALKDEFRDHERRLRLEYDVQREVLRRQREDLR